MNFHKLLDPKAFERRHNCFEVPLHEDSIKSVLITDGLEDVELDQGESMTFAVFKFLEELRLRLVVKISILGLLHVALPDGRVHDFGVHLGGSAYTLVYRQSRALFSCWVLAVNGPVRQFLLRLLHL